jgi:hypothetical protein
MKTIPLGTFLQQIETPLFVEEKKSIFFTGDKELDPILFGSLVRDFLTKKTIQYTMLDVTAQPIAHTYTTLSTSFLGMASCYWLKNINDLDTKTQAALLAFLHSYSGPHQVIICVPDLDPAPFSASWLGVQLLPMIDHTLFVLLAQCFGKPLSVKSRHISQRLFAQHKNVPLETACLLMFHLAVLGGSADDTQVLRHLEQLLDTKTSLFSLSGYLFAKQPGQFFTYWKTVSGDYQAVFWISFWTEQLWRAYYVVKYMHEKQPLDAKKIGFRLPFSFLQRDYKKVSLAELQRAHQFLYEADFQLKNGSSEFFLDLFYTKFLTGAFAQM